MNRIAVQKHPVHAGLQGRHRRLILVPPHRLENQRCTDLSCFNSLHRRGIRRIVPPHKSHLQPHTRLAHRIQRRISIRHRQRQRLLAQNILPRLRRLNHSLRMKLVRRRNQHSLQPLALQHGVQAAERVLNLQLLRHLFRPRLRHIGDRDQLRTRYQSPQILRVALPHLAHAQHAHLDLPHSRHSAPSSTGFLAFSSLRTLRLSVLCVKFFLFSIFSFTSYAIAATLNCPITPSKYRKLAATLSFGGISVAPNFTSCSITDQPEYPFLINVRKNAGKSMFPFPITVNTLFSIASSKVQCHFLASSSTSELQSLICTNRSLSLYFSASFTESPWPYTQCPVSRQSPIFVRDVAS